MDLEVCGRCKAFLQPTWDHCLICGAGKAEPDVRPAAPPPPAPAPGRPSGGGGTIAVIAAAVVLVVVVGVGALFFVGTTEEDDADTAEAARSEADRSQTAASEPLDPSDQVAYVDMFTTFVVAGFSNEGVEVDRACAHSVASRPEHASVIAEGMEGAMGGALDDPAMASLVEPIGITILRECVGIERLLTQALIQEEGLSPETAACAAAALAADPAVVAAFDSLGDYEPTPAAMAAVVACLSPAELEAMVGS